jgi:hypothetical protein
VFIITSVFSADLEFWPSSELQRQPGLEKPFLPLLATSPSETFTCRISSSSATLEHISPFLSSSIKSLSIMSFFQLQQVSSLSQNPLSWRAKFAI